VSKHQNAAITSNPPATGRKSAPLLFSSCKLSGFSRPSKQNEDAFNRAVDGVAQIARELLDSLVTNAPVRDRERKQ